MIPTPKHPFLIALLALTSVIPLLAQGALSDYERAAGLQDKFRPLALNLVDRAAWIGESHHFWYRRTEPDGWSFIRVDADSLTRTPAFDHPRLAQALRQAGVKPFEANRFPFSDITFEAGEPAILLDIENDRWRVDLSSYTASRVGPSPRGRRERPTESTPPAPLASPDGTWAAFTRNHNLWLRAAVDGRERPLSWDGSEGDAYDLSSARWSPDSLRLAIYRVRPGQGRHIHFIESSPSDQLQPRAFSRSYPKPGDVLERRQPVLFHVDGRPGRDIDATLFPNAYRMTELEWRKDGRAFSFEYNQRGHQIYRVIEVDADTGSARALVDEAADTFYCYYSKKFRADIDDGREVIWMSERSGWNHLYLIDGPSGQPRHAITTGDWVVRAVDRVDEPSRQIYFQASGRESGKDPCLAQAMRVGFDGSGLTPLTDADSNHSIVYSHDLAFFVDIASRVDHPTVTTLRRSTDGAEVWELERGDVTGLLDAGWRPPEVFRAPGRDGQTEIWGIIVRPMDFDPNRRYPVIEYIYAGPHNSFVPKTFHAWSPLMSLAELGFVVVQCDGMGTSNRSKAFHDVAWKNLADAGFPDRISWHRAAAARYPQFDLSRVGIFGHSAGGQNTMGALLFHPDFYHVGVSSCGCHDNRMDKISWNEQWMGWPVGPHYAAASNVDNAHRLQGRLLLTVGELDTNVDPASTLQVVNALIQADKVFDLMIMPGQGHTDGGAYGTRLRWDYFVRHLLGVSPPDWNRIPLPPTLAGKGTGRGVN